MGFFSNDLKFGVNKLATYCKDNKGEPLVQQLDDVAVILNFLNDNFELNTKDGPYDIKDILLAKQIRTKTLRVDTQALDYVSKTDPKNTLFKGIEKQLEQKCQQELDVLARRYRQGLISPSNWQNKTQNIRQRYEVAQRYLSRAMIKAQMAAPAIASKIALEDFSQRLDEAIVQDACVKNGNLAAIRTNLRAIQMRLQRHGLSNASKQDITLAEEGNKNGECLIIEEDVDKLYSKNDSLNTREELTILFQRVKKHLKLLHQQCLLKTESDSGEPINAKKLLAPLNFAENCAKVKNDVNYQYPTKENSELSTDVNKLVDRGVMLGVSGSACLLIGGILHFTPLAPVGTLLVVAGAAQSILCGFPAGLYRVGNAVHNASHGIAPRKDEVITFGLLGLSIATMGVTRFLPLNGALLKATNDSTKICLGTLGAIGVAGMAEGLIHRLEVNELEDNFESPSDSPVIKPCTTSASDSTSYYTDVAVYSSLP